MKKLANIYTKSKKNTFGEIFNVVSKYDDIIEGLPTLIIGFENAKQYIPDFNIIKKQYGNIWWTFTKTERRCEYEDDIIKFYKYAILSSMEKTKYVYVDLINYKLSSIKKVIKFLKDGSLKYIFLTKNNHFMFIYSEVYNTVFGISLELCECLGVEKQKIYKLIKNTKYIHNTKFMDNDIRKVVGSNTHYILPLYTYLN